MFSRRGFLALLPAPFLARFFPPPIDKTPIIFSFNSPGGPVASLGVVARKLYRTDANGSVYKLIATMGANDSEWTPVPPNTNATL